MVVRDTSSFRPEPETPKFRPLVALRSGGICLLARAEVHGVSALAGYWILYRFNWPAQYLVTLNLVFDTTYGG